ncbi:hypothetical protein F5Y16DRAFT_384555 [Xylariaceae sp. FL0255]|nr:hypothetical protein F5Y16DRAFT_384555 [Xylariaceae sp. FL0255]
MDDMDVDESALEPSPRLALIRAVRTLDDDASLPVSDKIHKLWLLLTSAKATRLHGVQESILRWLLKQMTSNDLDTAEHVRRYPLTWTTLAHVIPKIPAQSLGRSLAYLKFVSILNKTLVDLTKPQPQTNGDGGVPTKKRKKNGVFPATLDDLKSPEGCLKTATELFKALAILLEQANPQVGEVTPEKRVGAEHIKSLFSSAADETRDITTKMLLICSSSLKITDISMLEDQESWINISSTIWNLRLHSNEDSLEFARNLYRPASLMLAQLKSDTTPLPPHVNNACRHAWSRELDKFLNTFFIRPARQRFATDGNVDMMKMALAAGGKRIVPSATVMWNLAARTPRDSSNFKSKTAHAAWVDKIFEIILEPLESLPPSEYNNVLIRLLDVALQANSIPSNNILHKLYKTNAIATDRPDWVLISKILACDPEVFLADQSSETIFERISRVSVDKPEMRDLVVNTVIIPLQDAFGTARRLADFVRKWDGALRTCSSTSSVDTSIWFDRRIRTHLAAIIHQSLSGSQILRLLDALQPMGSQGGELLVILDGICAGLTDETTIDNVEPKIFSMAFPEQKSNSTSPEVLALGWRVSGYLASWESSKDFKKLWKEIKSGLKSTLKNGSLSDIDTLEAFSCGYQICLANHIGGKYEEEPIKLICGVIERLTSAIKTESDIKSFQPFLNVIFQSLPRLCEHPQQGAGDLSHAIAKIFKIVIQVSSGKNTAELVELAQSLIQNFDVTDEESFSDILIAQFLDALDSTDETGGWTKPDSLTTISILLQFPPETWTRGRRKRIMASWKKHQRVISSYAKKLDAKREPKYEIAIYRLLVMIMQQPITYEGMSFSDLPSVCLEMCTHDPAAHALVEKFIECSIRQVLTNLNDSTPVYLQQASEFAEKASQGPVTSMIVVLLKQLVAALDSHKASHAILAEMGSGPQIFSQRLLVIVEVSVGLFFTWAKPNLGKFDQCPLDHDMFRLLSIAIDAVRVLQDTGYSEKFELLAKETPDLQWISDKLATEGASLGWKLRALLAKSHPIMSDLERLILQECALPAEDDSISDLVDAFIQGKTASSLQDTLNILVKDERLMTRATVPLLAVKRLLEVHQGPLANDVTSESSSGSWDLARIHAHFATLLSQARSISQFQVIADILHLLLDKHGSAMSQYNIEATLVTVVEVCSFRGPKIEGPKAPGEIFATLFKLVALIIKRHRLRISGHFPILLAALRALLTVLLADPSEKARSSLKGDAKSQPNLPLWLHSRLQPRHGERFARLLTLICEPSAASVARHSSSSSHHHHHHDRLDSATDAAKRAAGQYMYLIIEVYIKLQLEAGVTKEMRRKLEVGLFSVLNITTDGGRCVLNESLDATGRALFRSLFAEYRKFGRWKGV